MSARNRKDSYRSRLYSVNMPADGKLERSGISNSNRNLDADLILRSLSTVQRSYSVLPSSLLDIDGAASAGLQVIRPETHPEAFVPLPPDGGWGWIIVFAAFTTNLIIDGICVSFGVMVNDLVDHFNTSVATVMLTGSLLVGCYQLVGPVAAGFVNKYGCRAVGLAGSLMACISMFLSAFMPTIELMLVAYGIIAGISFGLLHLPSIICVSFYFDSKRALATGIAVCGSPIGAMVFAPLTQSLLEIYGWSNTLIIYAGFLLNCAVFAALYRPLAPALLLKPMDEADAEVMKSLACLGDAKPVDALEPTSSGFEGSRKLHDQPLIEEDEEAEEPFSYGQAVTEDSVEKPAPVVVDKRRPKKEASTAEVAVANGTSETKEVENSSEKKVRHHHRHSRRHRDLERSRRPTAAVQHILDSFKSWHKQTKLKKGSVEKKSDDRLSGESGSNSTSESSSYSSCESEGGYHSHESVDGGKSGETTETRARRTGRVEKKSEDPNLNRTRSDTGKGAEEDEINEERDQLRPLISARPSRMRTSTVSSVSSRPPPEIVLTSAEKSKKRVPKRAISAGEFFLSTPNLGLGTKESRAEDWLHKRDILAREKKSDIMAPDFRTSTRSRVSRPSRYSQRVSGKSVVTMARIFPMRSVSVAAAIPSTTHLSTITGHSETDMAAEVENALRKQKVLDVIQSSVIVELPHDSIKIEDYSRPLYRKDIFFPGSIKRHDESSSPTGSANLGTSRSSVAATPGMATGSLLVGLETSGTHRRRTSIFDPSQFGSTLLFGDNVPMPPPTMGPGDTTDANWAGSCLMTLTKIPLPDVFEEQPEDEETAAMWDKLKSETGIDMREAPQDGIFRVPTSKSSCGWWLCWRTQNVTREDIVGEIELKKDLGDQLPAKSRLVLIRTCKVMPKSMWDVLTTMMDFSLLTSMSFSLICLSSLIAVIGVYIPLFFACDLAESFGISKSQSSLLLTFYGGTNTLSRLFFAWAAGRPNFSALVVSAALMCLCGFSVCILPFWGSFSGQVVIISLFGFCIAPFWSLTSIILCDILTLEALTNAYGLLTLVRGVSSSIGSPLAGMIVAATGVFSVAYVTSGFTIIIGGVLYAVVAFLERSKLRKQTQLGSSCDLDRIDV